MDQTENEIVAAHDDGTGADLTGAVLRSESSREDRIWQIRAAALQGVAANPLVMEHAAKVARDCDVMPVVAVSGAARDLAAEFLDQCDAADLEAKKANR